MSNNVMIHKTKIVVVDGRNVNVYNALGKAKRVPKIRVRGGMRGCAHYIISNEIWNAIKSYELNDGFAGMKLAVYLDRLFGQDTNKGLSSDKQKIP
jgi:hypothetical protein